MFKISLRSIFAIIAAVMILTVPFMGVAATSNPSPASPGYMTMPMPIMGTYTSNTTSVVKFKVPFPCAVAHVSATARASGGTTPTLTVDVKEGASSILSAPISITAGTVSDGTISDSKLADESLISIDLAIGGTSPNWKDITLLLLLKRL